MPRQCSRVVGFLCSIALLLPAASILAAPHIGHFRTVLVPRDLVKLKWSALTGLTRAKLVIEASGDDFVINGRRNWRASALPLAFRGTVTRSSKRRIDVRKGTTTIEIQLKGKWSQAARDRLEAEVMPNLPLSSPKLQVEIRSRVEKYVARLDPDATPEIVKSDADLLSWFAVNSSALEAEVAHFRDQRVLSISLAKTNEYYNSNRLNKKERVARVLIEVLLPLVRESSRMISDDRQWLRFKIRIPHKQFTDELAPLEYDDLALLVEPAKARSFADAEITDQDLVNQSVLIVDGSRTEISLSVAD